MDYTGTPLETDYERIKRRRAIMQAMQEQAIAPKQGQMVGDIYVPSGIGAGLADLGKAWLSRKGENRLDEREKALGETYRTKSSESVQKVLEALEGKPNYSEAGPQVPVAPNLQRAGIMSATDPWLQNNDAMQKVIQAQIDARTSGTNSPYQFISTPQGIVRGDKREGTLELPEQTFMRATDDPGLQAEIARQKQLALGGAEAATDPITASRIRQAESNVDLTMKPAIGAATTTAEALAGRAAEKVIDKPKVESALDAASKKTSMLDETINKAIDQTGAWTAGLLGSATSWVPGTPAYDLGSTLSTIKANIGFDKLQEMRDNSPTGGALGQVSEFENKLLQAVWGALEQSQSPQQLKENLEKVRQQTKESWARIREAYKKDYGVEYGEKPTETNDGKPEGWSEDKWRRYQELKGRQAQP